MARYAIIQGGIVRNVVEATPEMASANGWVAASDRAEIGWEYAGEAFAAPMVDPAETRAKIAPITRRQARLALLGIGKLDDVTSAIDALPSPNREAAQIEWQDALTFERSHPLITTIGGALGLTDEQIDDLFITAAAI